MGKNLFDISTINTLIQVSGVVITVLVGLVTLFLNERIKREQSEYQRKEERYIELVKALRGFRGLPPDNVAVENFLLQLDLCWLYCPDDVIRKAYEFLSTIKTGQEKTSDEKDKALGEFILAIRKDLLNRKKIKGTNLKSEDFKHLKPGPTKRTADGGDSLC